MSPLLAAVADNGEVSKLGKKALDNAIERKKAIEHDPRIPAEDKKNLANAWQQRIDATRAAIAGLEKARKRFLQLMYALQSKEVVIGEWEALKAQDEIVATIKQLTKSLEETSNDVSNFIASFERPGV